MKAILFIKYILPKQVVVLFTDRLEGIFFLSYHINSFAFSCQNNDRNNAIFLHAAVELLS